MPPLEAIPESVRTRIRPIFITTGTTVLGLLPLVLFPGAGSELYWGLGSVVLGGLIVSTIFTLVLVPTVFALTMNARSGLARLIWGSTSDVPLTSASATTGDEEPDLSTVSNGRTSSSNGHHVDDAKKSPQPTQA